MSGRKRIICLLLALLIFCGGVTEVINVNAAVVTKTEKTYDIAVVFDNSGSMYQNQAWCRAKYAMEIFASMLNYNNGDTLKIFPMWEVTKDGSTPETGGSFEGFGINNVSDIDQIAKLYTVNPSNTPFEPIKEAYDYLKGSSKSEKWLIILTDGAFNQEKRGESAQFNLQKKVEKLASEEINVQYLGFGEAQTLKSKESNNFFAKKSSDTSLKDDLVSICNSIFQRSVLPTDKLNGSNLSLDLSMKNLIVFAQGENAKIDTLINSDGEEIGILFDSGQRKYSTIKAKGYEDAPIDKSLAGQVVTFAACPKGEYTLTYSGADSIQVFYEPDVDIQLEFTDVNGEVIDLEKDDIVAGEYKLNYGIVDNVTGEDAVNSGLLGKDVDLKAWVVNEKGEQSEIKKDGNVTLEPGQETYFKVEGIYLKDYKITTEDNKEAYTFEVQLPEENKLDIAATVQQENNWYKQSEHESWKPINVVVNMDGQPLTDEQMAAIEWDIKSEDITWNSEIVPGESALNIHVGYDKDGNYVKPDNGKYEFAITAAMKDEYDRALKDSDEVKIEIQSYSVIGKWLRWILPIAALIIGFLLFMSQKVMPKSIKGEGLRFEYGVDDINPAGKVFYNKKAKTLAVKSSPVEMDMNAECHATLVLKPVDRRWTTSSNRRVKIVDIRGTRLGTTQIVIGRITYVKNDAGKWVNLNKPNDPIDQDVKNTQIIIVTDNSTFNCRTRHK